MTRDNNYRIAPNFRDLIFREFRDYPPFTKMFFTKINIMGARSARSVPRLAGHVRVRTGVKVRAPGTRNCNEQMGVASRNFATIAKLNFYHEN